MESPAHYTRGSIEVWDFIRDQDLNYHLGNAIKYICRAGFKGDNTKTEDLKKAIHYLENELEHTNTSTTSKRIPKVLQPWEREDYFQEDVSEELSN